ncbi:DnaT-like ssDNA-binding protein [Sulfurospirillum sp. UCH001]|uniref:DnaT-like ssDNA-binding protein n=1 Tax=Sulfurospirillum sp. UCH001 TaxID=1581011 RepID=UPI0008296CA6|nr:DnaT-like ssDNA-binding protein [Sulfurospirillum sp. UCH001]
MALTVGTNSYISLEDAKIYFEDRLNSADWDSSTDPVRSKALIQATQIIDQKDFLGYKSVNTQALKFPRTGLVDDGIDVDGSTIPKRVKDAVCELAIWCLSEDYTEPNDMEAYQSIKIAVIEVQTRQGNKSMPPMVTRLLSPFMFSGTRIVRG